jgi:hypothetical protein
MAADSKAVRAILMGSALTAAAEIPMASTAIPATMTSETEIAQVIYRLETDEKGVTDACRMQEIMKKGMK